MPTIYDQALDKNTANYQPLTPLHFLSRAALVHPERVAIVHGERRITYREYYSNAHCLASALSERGVKPGETVAIMAANIPAFLDASFGVPMMGAVLNTLNTRLDASTLAYILDHSECRVLLSDTAYAPVIKEALALCER